MLSTLLKTIVKISKKSIGILFLVGAIIVITMLFEDDPIEDIIVKKDSLLRVSTISLDIQTQHVPITSQGVIDARWRSTLVSDVSGKVLFVSPSLFIGGKFKQGEVLLRIDDSRYQAELAQAKSEVAIAKQQLHEEQQKSQRAQQNWQASGLPGKPSDLLLRKPQLRSAKQRIAATTAAQMLAQKNVNKTVLIAPYDGTTIKRKISLGDFLTTEGEIAEIYAHKLLQTRLPLTQSQASQLMKNDSVAVQLKSLTSKKTWQTSISRYDRVINPNNNWVHAIVELDNSSKETEMPLLGEFIEAQLNSPLVQQVVKVPEDCINGDSRIWHVNAESTLALLDNNYLSHANQHVYLQINNEFKSDTLNIVCNPSKSFSPGMAVAMVTKPTAQLIPTTQLITESSHGTK
ncbi:MAG: efflux RND transporter periplasmic adaptor subunit [Arenicella sp.]